MTKIVVNKINAVNLGGVMGTLKSIIGEKFVKFLKAFWLSTIT